MEASEFIEKFHGLSGRLLKERKKELFLLLNSYHNLVDNEDVLKEICATLVPRTYLEETYRLEFLLRFKRVWQLFELMKNGKDIATSRIIREKWFLETILKDVSPKTFVTDIFPQISVVVRFKILKQILKQFKDESYINSLFDELNKSYGSRFAIVLISGCSQDKIKNFLRENGLKIPLAQLKLFHDKNRSLIRFYYGEYYKRGEDMNSLDSFSHYLAKKDPNLFMELVLKYKIITRFRLGREGTKCFVDQFKNDLIEDPVKYLELDILKKSTLVRRLGKDFPKYLKGAFPESWRILNPDIFTFLDYYPKKRRYMIFSTLFREVYNKDLTAVKEIVNEELLEVVPNHEEREKWVALFNNDVKYIKYKRSTIAVPELKEHLLRADNIKFRTEILEYIVTSCSISKDYITLLDILKLVCKRFRNTSDGVLSTFLCAIEAKIELKKLEEAHWKYIEEIIMLYDRNNSLDSESVIADFIFEYCKFQYISEKSFENMIPLFLQCQVTSSKFKFSNDDFKDQKFQKLFLELLLNNYVTLDKEKRSSDTSVQIVLAIKEWNKNHPKELILVSGKDVIIQEIQEKVEGWVYYFSDEMRALKYLICSENDTDHFEQIYFENVYLPNYSITKWFLKYKPEVFLRHIDRISSYFPLTERKKLDRYLRKLEYTGLTEAITEHCTRKLNEVGEENKDIFARILASTMATESYLRLIEMHIPKIEKLELSEASEEEKTSSQIEISLAKSVRFCKSHQEVLPLLLGYCKGDCLSPSLYSLYSCFNRISEKDLKPYFSVLLEKPVSLRKHTIFLAALVFPTDINREMVEKRMIEEKDISVRKHIFTSSYKYFLKNPSDQFWKILKNFIESLTIHDKESLQLITKIHDVPLHFKKIFAKTVWQTIKRLEETEKNPMTEHYDAFFSNIRDFDLQYLSSNFCIEIIKNKLFQDGYKRNAVCSKFAIHYMLYGDQISRAVQGVMGILEEYKMQYWNGEKESHARHVVYLFCREIFDTVMSENHLRIDSQREFPLILEKEWKRIFKWEESFEEYFMLELIILKYKTERDLQIFSRRIGELFENAREKFGEGVLLFFREFLRIDLGNLIRSGNKPCKKELMAFLKYFIEQGPASLTKYVLVISLLPMRIEDEIFMKNYNFVLDEIRKFPDPIISITLNSIYKRGC